MSVGKLDRLILEDKRIRRILTNNEKLIRDAERKEGNTNLHQFNAYLANSLTVWEENKKGKYLSVNLVVKYLKICGYSIDYAIVPLDSIEK
jgi:hypothetical protein